MDGWMDDPAYLKGREDLKLKLKFVFRFWNGICYEMR